jgi:nitrite reductase (NADH) small subunit
VSAAAEAVWVDVGAAADVPLMEGRSVAYGAVRVAVFRLADGWAAIEHACPHKAGPLADGIVGERCVTCPLHNWRFDLDTGEQVGGGARLRTFAVRERDGRLELGG